MRIEETTYLSHSPKGYFGRRKEWRGVAIFDLFMWPPILTDARYSWQVPGYKKRKRNCIMYWYKDEERKEKPWPITSSVKRKSAERLTRYFSTNFIFFFVFTIIITIIVPSNWTIGRARELGDPLGLLSSLLLLDGARFASCCRLADARNWRFLLQLDTLKLNSQ